MRRYAVKTRFTFTGTFFVTARNKDVAKELVEKHCGLVMGRGIHSTFPEENCDWDFPMHPDKTVSRVSEMVPGLRMITVHTSRRRWFSKAAGNTGGLYFTASVSRICEL